LPAGAGNRDNRFSGGKITLGKTIPEDYRPDRGDNRINEARLYTTLVAVPRVTCGG